MDLGATVYFYFAKVSTVIIKRSEERLAKKLLMCKELGVPTELSPTYPVSLR